MTKLVRSLIALLLAGAATAVVACTPEGEPLVASQSDGGTQNTDGGTLEVFVNQATRHASYIPDGYKPTSAARLIVIGDSISAGVGASTSGLSYYGQLLRNSANKWPDEMATSLSEKFGSQPELVKVAVSGATTNDLVDQEEDLRSKGPFSGHSIATITIGGNDLQGALASNGNPTGALLESAIENITYTIDLLQDPELFPDGTSIYLMAVYDPTDGKGQANGCFLGISRPQFIPALDTWRERYIELAKEKRFAVVDALGHFQGHGANHNDPTNQYYDENDPTRWFANDCIHPNDRGHHELRRLFFEAIDWDYVATP